MNKKMLYNVLLAVIFKPIKRLTGLVLFVLGVFICGITVYPFLFLFFGFEVAGKWMDRNILPITGWWD